MSKEISWREGSPIPTNIDEARNRLIVVRAEISLIDDELAEPERRNPISGVLLTETEYNDWRIRALSARRHMMRERAFCISYLKMYEHEVEAEEKAEHRSAMRQLEQQKVRVSIEKIAADPTVSPSVVKAVTDRHKYRKQQHKEWLAKLEIDEPLDGMDAENLLVHAYRIIRDLKNQFDYDERWSAASALMRVIDQRVLIVGGLEDDQMLGEDVSK